MFNTIGDKIQKLNNIKNNTKLLLEFIKTDTETKDQLENVIVLMTVKDGGKINEKLNEKYNNLINIGYINENGKITSEGEIFYFSQIGYLNDGKIGDEIDKMKELLGKESMGNNSKEISQICYKICLIFIFTMLKDLSIWDIFEFIEGFVGKGESNETATSKNTVLTYFTKIFL